MSTAGKILVRPGAIASSIVRRATSGGVRRHASNLKPANQDKGYFLDLGPHRKREGWEEITVATGIASAAILIIGLGYGPETSIKEWARNEALARNAREAKGLPLEYGKIYSQEPIYAFTPAEGDDDDEEEEDEEEEDEEE